MATGNICPGCRGRRRRRATRETVVGREVKQLQVQCLSCLLFCGRVKRSSSSIQVSGIHSGRGRQAGLSRWLLKIRFVAFKAFKQSVFAKVERRTPKWGRWMRSTQRQEGGRTAKMARGCSGLRRGLAPWNKKPLQLVPYPRTDGKEFWRVLGRVQDLQLPPWQ